MDLTEVEVCSFDLQHTTDQVQTQDFDLRVHYWQAINLYRSRKQHPLLHDCKPYLLLIPWRMSLGTASTQVRVKWEENR